MTEPVPKSGRWWQIPVWAIMLVPLACAPVFLIFVRIRDPRGFRPVSAYEHDWAVNPLKERFWPEQGARVEWGDPIVKVASVSRYQTRGGRYFGYSWWVTPDGVVHDAWHTDADAGGMEKPASVAGLEQLPDLLRKLPPSDPAAEPPGRTILAFPDKGQWVVRVYRRQAEWKAADELIKALGGLPSFETSY
jgi:hypothetical protein